MIYLLFSAFRHRVRFVATVGVSLVVGCGILEGKEKAKAVLEGHDIFIFSDIVEDGPVPEWKRAGALGDWERELGERIGEVVRVSIVSSALGVKGLNMMGEPSVAVIPVVEMERCAEMIPEFLVEHREGLHSKFMLLAPRGGTITRGIVPERVGLFDSTMMMPWSGRVWAHSVLPELKISSIHGVRGSDSVVIPVFFGRAAHGVVDLDGFEAEVRRNSQVKDEVVVIAESPPILGNAVFMREDLSSAMAAKLKRELVLSSKGESGALVFSVLGWHALRPVAEQETALISKTLAMLVGNDGDDATAEAKVKGGKK